MPRTRNRRGSSTFRGKMAGDAADGKVVHGLTGMDQLVWGVGEEPSTDDPIGSTVGLKLDLKRRGMATSASTGSCGRRRRRVQTAGTGPRQATSHQYSSFRPHRGEDGMKATTSTATVAVSLLILGLSAPSARAQQGETDEGLCPRDRPAVQYFGDVEPPHAEAVNCLAFLEIVRGGPDGSFRPGSFIPRDQLASVLDGLIDDVNNRQLAESGREFTDLQGGVHEDAISRMGRQGFVSGHPDGTYRPSESLTRGQIATIAVIAHDILIGPLPEGDRDAFRDIDMSPHEAAIAAAHDAGLVRGFGDGTFRPNDALLRGQAATVLFKLGNLLGSS